jgi:hypothetical protein
VLIGDEVHARHGPDRVQHALVPDAGLARGCDESVHAASMRLCPCGRARARS